MSRSARLEDVCPMLPNEHSTQQGGINTLGRTDCHQDDLELAEASICPGLSTDLELIPHASR